MFKRHTHYFYYGQVRNRDDDFRDSPLSYRSFLYTDFETSVSSQDDFKTHKQNESAGLLFGGIDNYNKKPHKLPIIY